MKPKQPIITLYKNRGETPLECINRFKKENPEYEKDPMTYAGRLDPLAEGLLLVLVGEECKNNDKHLCSDKTYEVDILFGFSTDTYDLLGKVIDTTNTDKLSVYDADKLFEILKSFVGKFSQKYPPFSSKTINGKSLFNLFKSGELKDEEIPEKDVEIKSIDLLWGHKISKNELEKYIEESVSLVKGDFRQKEIIEIWKKELSNNEALIFPVVSIEVSCTSGTYMRSLANEIGKKVGIPALALNIKRTKMGNFNI